VRAVLAFVTPHFLAVKESDSRLSGKVATFPGWLMRGVVFH